MFLAIAVDNLANAQELTKVRMSFLFLQTQTAVADLKPTLPTLPRTLRCPLEPVHVVSLFTSLCCRGGPGGLFLFWFVPFQACFIELFRVFQLCLITEWGVGIANLAASWRCIGIGSIRCFQEQR